MSKRSKAAPQVARPPFYDPAVHTDPDQWVYVELVCACGRIWRQRDPVALVEPQVRHFLAQHVGEGHGPVSKADAVAEREARRQAAFRARGRAGDYQPQAHPNLDTSDTTARPWPVFPEPQQEI